MTRLPARRFACQLPALLRLALAHAPASRSASASRSALTLASASPLTPPRPASASCPAAPFFLMFWEREKLSFLPLLLDPGNFLLSQAVPSSVPSAFGGLTSVFGMGTGGALQLSSPETFLRGAPLASRPLRSLRFRSASSPLGSLPLPAPSKLHRSELTSKLSLFFVSRSRSLALSPLPRPSRSLPLALPQIKPSTD